MTTTFHRLWRGVPENTLRWPNFSDGEIACRSSKRQLIDKEALNRLQPASTPHNVEAFASVMIDLPADAGKPHFVIPARLKSDRES